MFITRNLTEAATSGTTLPDSVSEAIYHKYLPDSIGLEVSYYESYVVLCSFIGWAAQGGARKKKNTRGRIFF